MKSVNSASTRTDSAFDLPLRDHMPGLTDLLEDPTISVQDTDPARDPFATQNSSHAKNAHALPLQIGPKLPDAIADSIPEPTNTAKDNHYLGFFEPAVPDELLKRPISELHISVRAHNCLQRIGINTIGYLLTILPQGYAAVRNAGPKTWSEIENAVTDYVSKYRTRVISIGDARPLRIDPTGLNAHGNDTRTEQSIESLGMPSNIADALRSRGITTAQVLATSPLFQLAQIPELSSLTYEEWFNLMPKLRRCKTIEPRSPILGDPRAIPSLLALSLSARPLACLFRAGIFDLSTLSQRTLTELSSLRNFGAKSFEELFGRLRAALNSGAIILDDSSLRADLPDSHSVSEAVMPYDAPALLTAISERKPAETQVSGAYSLDERFNAWFAHLTQRQREVLRWRFGLTNGQVLTFKEVGERLDVTRERARQIETKALLHLQRTERKRTVSPLLEQIHQTVVAAGGVLGEAELADALVDTADIGDIHPQGALRLLLETSEKLSRVKGVQAWCLPQLCDLIPDVGLQVIEVLKQALAPMLCDELLRRVRLTLRRDDQPNEQYDKFILACIRVNEKLVERDEGSIGLATWEHHWQDDIVLALRRLGQPTHYTVIADTINASQQSDQQVTARAVHTLLMRYPGIFVWIGRKGTYGLSEWGIERSISYADALTQILQDARHPLTITEVLAALVKLRPYYDEGSVQITLGTNGKFRAFPNNTFGLAEWREEDFAGERYRLQRLFENAEKVTLTRTKQEVVESLSTVDDFIERIRGNHDG